VVGIILYSIALSVPCTKSRPTGRHEQNTNIVSAGARAFKVRGPNLKIGQI